VSASIDHRSGQLSASAARPGGRPAGTPPGRADAKENRALVVAAARDVLVGSDELRLSAVAKKAGVGQGTVYRNFPTTAQLLAEVYRTEVDQLVALAPVLLDTHRPLAALSRWLQHVADYAEVKRGLMAAVETGVWRELVDHSLGPIGDAITTLLDAGKRDGSIRRDVDARDVILLIGYLSRISDTDARTRHLLTLVVDALRSREPD
jgi:AcrR family transcriptional regulator